MSVATKLVGVNERALRCLTSEFCLKGFPSSQSAREPFLLALQVTGCFWNQQSTPVMSNWCMRRSEGGNEAHIRRDAEFRVGERVPEGSLHRGFVRIVAVRVGGFDLQGNVFLLAQLDHGDVILPLTATINFNNKARAQGFSRKKKTCLLLQFEWKKAAVSRHVTIAI